MTCFWKHQFGKWKVVDRRMLQSTDRKAGTRITGWLLLQERSCEKCGYIQRSLQENEV